MVQLEQSEVIFCSGLQKLVCIVLHDCCRKACREDKNEQKKDTIQRIYCSLRKISTCTSR